MKDPYARLYIYYFSGVPQIDTRILNDPSFLGVWEDEDICFVFFSSKKHRQVADIVKCQPEISLVDTYEMTGEQWHGDKIVSLLH
jgi:ribosomal protein L11 methyltransferase